MLHPKQFGDIPYPKALSPSAVMEFKKCPQSFLFQYLYKLRQPTSLALAKGSMCHEALEKVFDLDPQDRTLEHLQNLLRVSWGDKRLSDAYRFLFETDSGDRDIDAERTWGQSALRLLENYYQIEDPRMIDRANPLKREIWLNAHLTVDPTHGTTATGGGGASPSKGSTPTFHVRGIVDRLDMVRLSPRQVAMRIVDYKTGKAPNLKYSKAANERIMEETFYQLKIYALLLREKGAGAQQPKGMDLRLLRLLFLTSEQGRAQNLDFDLGETQEERDTVLQEVHQDLSNVWTEITELVSQQDPKAFVGCDRSFCYCHKCRDRFVPDSVWEPN
jgi:RecB family exonuclease